MAGADFIPEASLMIFSRSDLSPGFFFKASTYCFNSSDPGDVFFAACTPEAGIKSTQEMKMNEKVRIIFCMADLSLLARKAV
jgi:hypothetical protein